MTNLKEVKNFVIKGFKALKITEDKSCQVYFIKKYELSEEEI